MTTSQDDSFRSIAIELVRDCTHPDGGIASLAITARIEADRTQYRVRIDGMIGPVLDTYPSDRWSKVVDFCEQRGTNAALERRLVTDPGICEFFEDGKLPCGWMRFGDLVICDWEVCAEYQGRRYA